MRNPVRACSHLPPVPSDLGPQPDSDPPLSPTTSAANGPTLRCSTAWPCCRGKVITMELTQRHNHPHPLRRAAFRSAGVAAPALFALGVVLITWAEWDLLRGLGFTLTAHGESAWPSGLAQGPVGWAQIVNSALFGIPAVGVLRQSLWPVISTTEIEVLGKVSGYTRLACTPAVSGRRPS
jgi:hypothetical protein